MTFYINGAKIVEWHDTPGAAVTTNDHNLVFGRAASKYAADDVNYEKDFIMPLNLGGYFRGALADIRIYNKILSPSQVQTIYELEKVFE